MRNLMLRVGLVLSFSILPSGPGQAKELPHAPGPEEICSAFPFLWRLPCLALQTPRDPWDILLTTPGVLTDHLPDRGSGCGCGMPPPTLKAGSSVGEGFLGVDEMLATPMAVAGLRPSDLDPHAFVEIPVEPVEPLDLGGGPPAPAAPVWLLPSRGTNVWRALGSALGTSGGGRGAGEGDRRFDSLRAADASVGGPLVVDRLWAWGEGGLHQLDRTVLGGQREERTGRGGRFKLNAQPRSDTSAILAGSRGRSEGTGIGAGPGRAPETTWKEDGREDVWAAEGFSLVSRSFYLGASLGGADRRLGDRPRSAGDGARIGPDGVVRGSWFDLREERRTEQARLVANVFAGTRSVEHEIALGTGWRGAEESRAVAPPDPLVTAGGILGLSGGLALAELWRAGEAEARTHTLGLWAQDQISAGDWTTMVGLRADRQSLGFPGGGSPWTLLPRLELDRFLGEARKTRIWTSLSRYASEPGPRAAWHLDPGAPALLRGIFEDRDADLSLDPGEPLHLLPGEGIDPLRPGVNPNAVDPRLRPEITDEAALGFEHLLSSNFLIGLRAAWRRTRDLLEERLLARDTPTGRVFVATAGDWVPAGRLTGALPDGTAYDVPVWDLRPGLLSTSGTLLVNGDRRRESLGLTFNWLKRLADRWMTRGDVTWRDGRQRLGSSFRRFDDPTNTLGGGDDESLPVAEIASGRPHEIPGFVASRWSFHALGLFELREGLDFSAAVNARQGQPLPYYRQAARERAGLALVQLTGRPDALRTDDLLTLDVRLEKGITLGDVDLLLSLEAANLLSSGAVLERELDLGTGRAARASDALAARALRFQVRVFWR